MQVGPVQAPHISHTQFSEPLKNISPNFSPSTLSSKPFISIRDILLAVCRIFTFLPSILFTRRPKFSHIDIPEITKEQRKEYNAILNKYSWDWLGKGPTREQKIQLLHQFISFKKHSAEQRLKVPETKLLHSSELCDISLDEINVSMKDLDQDSFIEQVLSKNFSKITLSFKCKATVDHGYGPYQIATSSYRTKMSLNGKEFTVETLDKRTRNRRSYTESLAKSPIR